MEGWIKLHRRTLENSLVCKDSDYFAVWCYLLLNATHAELEKMFAGERIILKKGQLITGRKIIANTFCIQESKVQRILKKLEIEHQIEQRTCNANRLITIVNWNMYQEDEQPNEQPVNNQRQPVNTNKNVKNDKNERNNITVSKDTVCSKDLLQIIEGWNSLGLTKVVSIKNKRLEMLNVRIREHGLENVLKAIRNISTSQYLKGQNKYGWIITFDWFIKPNNFIKVLEGNYQDRAGGSTDGTNGGYQQDTKGCPGRYGDFL